MQPLVDGSSGGTQFAFDYHVRWDTGDGETAETIVAPLIARLVHDAIVLTIHALSSAALATLAKIDDRMLWCLMRVNLNPIE